METNKREEKGKEFFETMGKIGKFVNWEDIRKSREEDRKIEEKKISKWV